MTTQREDITQILYDESWATWGACVMAADALTEAGFGSQHDAWAEGYTAGNAHNGRRDANPYPGATS